MIKKRLLVFLCIVIAVAAISVFAAQPPAYAAGETAVAGDIEEINGKVKVLGIIKNNDNKDNYYQYRTYLLGNKPPSWKNGTKNGAVTVSVPAKNKIRVFEYKLSGDDYVNDLHFAARPKLAAADAATAYEIDYEDETITIKQGHWYLLKGTSIWKEAVTDVTVPYRTTLSVRTSSSFGSVEDLYGDTYAAYIPTSTVLKVPAPSNWKKPSAAFDAVNVKIKVSVPKGLGRHSYEWTEDPTGKSGYSDLLVVLKASSPLAKAEAGYAAIPLSSSGKQINEESAKTIYVRVKTGAQTATGFSVTGVGGSKASPLSKAIVIPKAGTAFSGGDDEVRIDYETEKLEGVKAGMEYKLPNAKSWIKGTATTEKNGISLTAALNKMGANDDGDILVRYTAVKASSANATTAATAGEEAAFNVKGRRGVQDVKVKANTETKGYLELFENNNSFYNNLTLPDLLFGTTASNLSRLSAITVSGFEPGEDSIEKLEDFVVSNAGKKIYVAYPHNDYYEMFRSSPLTISLPARISGKPEAGTNYTVEFNKISISADSPKATQLRMVSVTTEYSAAAEKTFVSSDYGSWSSDAVQIGDENAADRFYDTVPKVSAAYPIYIERYVEVRFPGENGSLPSSPVKVSMNRPAAPSVTLDYAEEAFKGLTASMEYRTYEFSGTAIKDKTAWSDVPTSPAALSPAALENKVVEIRLKANGAIYPSKAKIFEVAPRPDAPSEEPGADFTLDYGKRTLSPVKAALEYTFGIPSAQTAWATLPANFSLSAKIDDDEATERQPDGSHELRLWLRFKSTLNAPASDYTAFVLPIPKAPSFGDVFTDVFDAADNVYIITPQPGADDIYEWKLSSSNVWSSSMSDITISAASALKTLQFREKHIAAAGGEEGVVAGKIKERDYPEGQAPKLSDFPRDYDGIDLVLNCNAEGLYQVRTNEKDAVWKPQLLEEGSSIDIAGYYDDDGFVSGKITKLDVRKVAVSSSGGIVPVSETLTITLAAAANAPVAPAYRNVKIMPSATGKDYDVAGEIFGVTGAMEYRYLDEKTGKPAAGSAGEWTQSAGDSISLVERPASNQIAEIRVAATSNAPPSKAKEIGIPNRNIGPYVKQSEDGKTINTTAAMEWCIVWPEIVAAPAPGESEPAPWWTSCTGISMNIEAYIPGAIYVREKNFPNEVTTVLLTNR